MLIWAIIAAGIVIFDQLAKLLVIYNIGPTDCFHIIPGLFDFVYVKNTGAAFSILSDNTGILSVVSIIFCIGVVWYWYKKKPASTLLKASLCLLFAGALGNAIDRILRGFVVDFISTAFMNFPVFNIADIAITCGAVLLAIYFIFFDKDEKMEKITLLTSNPDSLRIDKYIAESVEDVSRSYAATLCEEKRVTVGGKVVDKKYQPKDGEVIEIDMPEPENLDLVPEDIPLDIVYEDDDVIVVNKPQGMVVHPANGNTTGTLVNALLYHAGDNLSAINGVVRPGIVHRIDKDTAGLLVVAKNNDAHNALAEQLKARKASRKYYALVNGTVKEGGTVNKPIARHPKDRKKMAVVSGGREAVTHYRVLENFSGYTLLECILETGRTHQIRVHMASLGHSLVGDRAYGIAKEKIKTEGQLLFAKTIGFNHPKTGEYMEFTADLPDYFEEILEKLRRSNGRG